MRCFPKLLAGAALGLAAWVSMAMPGVAEEPIAKQLFGHKDKPAAMKARAIGFYSRGCLAGGVMLPVNGPAWQAMRLSRNRNWGHPDLVNLVQRLAVESQKLDGWPGLLIGDLAQPRGGPMLTGHASHQVGLDADIWLMPMPGRELTGKEREEISAISMIKNDFEINEQYWRPGHVTLIKRAAEIPKVERIFVHPAIKKALCEAAGPKAPWLGKVRPYWGHHYHFHIRIKCPPGSADCKDQAPPGGDAGCGKELDDWFAMFRRPKDPSAKPTKRKEIMVQDLPNECRAVLAADDASPRQFAASPPPMTAGYAMPAATPPRPPAAQAQNGANLPWLNGLTTPPPMPDRRPR